MALKLPFDVMSVLAIPCYTYLVDLPSRMNNNQLYFLTGFSWGYTEDKNGNVQLFDLEILSKEN